MSLRTKLGGLFLSAVAARVGFHLATGFTADDAFITFRYAENLALGNGFVYNLGERVLGTSTPLFTWLLAVLDLLRFPVVTSALIIALICSGLTAVFLYRFASILRFGRLAWLPALAYILWPRSIVAETCGLETALFTLLVVAAFYYHHRHLSYYAIGLTTLATLTRPEGVIILGLLLFSACRRDHNCWKSYLATSALLLVPWLVFAQLYFGSVIPHSVVARLSPPHFGTEFWWGNLVCLMGWGNPVSWLLLVAALIGGRWLYRTQDFGALEGIWLGVNALAYTLAGTQLLFLFIGPLYPLYLLLASAAVVWIGERSRYLHYRHRALASVAAALVIILSTVGLYHQVDEFRTVQRYSDEILKPVAFYLRRNSNPERDVVAAKDIGVIGYYSKCQILDGNGVVSPVALPFAREGQYLDMLLVTRPEWVGLEEGRAESGFLDDSRFLAEYKQAKTFSSPGERNFHLYRRTY